MKGLFIGHHYPLRHGAAIVSDSAIEVFLRNSVSLDCIQLSSSLIVEDIGKIKLYKFFYFFKLLFEVIRKSHKQNYDFIYYTPSVGGIAILRDSLIKLILICFYRDVPIYHHLHMLPTENKILRVFSKFVLMKCKVIILASSLKESYNDILDSSKVYILPNFITPASVDLPVKAKTNSIIFIGHLTDKKGFFRALQIFERVNSRFNIKFHVCGLWGDADFQSLCMKFIQKCNLQESVVFHGYVNGDEKLKLISTCDACILPSYSEALPLVLLECLYVGTPFVATHIGGIPDIAFGTICKTVNQDCSDNVFIRDFSEALEFFVCFDLYDELIIEMNNKFKLNYTLQKFEKTLLDIVGVV